jgi:NADPH-dependent 2,4-dienoyl-CoA reductase/sulfur reductase-like enzyme
MLRREGYQRSITIISADQDPPVDRPNLSKDFLAGEAQDDWLPLWPWDFYQRQHVDLLLGSRVQAIDPSTRSVVLESGSRHAYGALLLATGAEPVRLDIPGSDPQRVLLLRSAADSRAIIDRAQTARQVVVVGASFIGLEVAASLRARGIGVDVVGRESLPLERTLGPALGRFVQSLHESHGVTFHLGQTVTGMAGPRVVLDGGETLEADFVVMGVGVTPATRLGATAGVAVDRGILADEYLETSVPGIFTAGDVARWPDPRTGRRIRVEHWVVAERQGQTAARNMLGRRERFDAIPFFWSQHYDTTIRYVGHAERWDSERVEGSLEALDAAVYFEVEGRRAAIATVGRDLECLKAELMFERELPRPQPGLEPSRG